MRPDLPAVLSDARRLGLLGPGPVQEHIEHARGFAVAAGSAPRGRVVDLGSGAGIPGLVLALTWPDVPFVLVDSSLRRSTFLDDAVTRLGLGGQVSVMRARAEVLGRDSGWRGTAELVVARSFGPPAVVAECAAPLLAVGGRLVVSEPPSRQRIRWPAQGVAALGLRLGSAVQDGGRAYQVLRQECPCPGSFPRRTGIPGKRPLF